MDDHVTYFGSLLRFSRIHAIGDRRVSSTPPSPNIYSRNSAQSCFMSLSRRLSSLGNTCNASIGKDVKSYLACVRFN